MSVAKRMMEEQFMIETEDGEMEYPEDFDICGRKVCGYVGLGWNNKICPKCKKLSIITEMVQKNSKEFTNRKRTSHSEDNIHKQISEMWTANKYRNEGYVVMKTCFYDFYSNSTIPDKEGLLRFLESYEQKEKLLNLIKSLGHGLPDLIRTKDNIVSFVEVKSNGSSISEKQKETLEVLKNNGYDTFVVWVNTECEVRDYKEVQVSDLEKCEVWNGDIYFK